MTTENALPPVDRRLAALVWRQYGVVSRDQLRRLGIGDSGIAERVRTGRLHRLHRGVYAVGHAVLRREGYWFAAVLAGGPGAVLSHTAAAALWGIRGSSAATIDVTVPTQNGRVKRKGLRIHRSGRLGAEQVTVHEGTPVTTLARTLLDLADVLTLQALKRAIHEADYLRLLDVTTLTAVVQDNSGRRGGKLLRAVASPPEMTKSKLEERFLAIVARHNLPRPKVNTQIASYEVDFAWPEAKLIVETDGFAAHGTPKAFADDRRRDRHLRRAGFETIRLTPKDLDYEAEVVGDVEALLNRPRVSEKPPSRASTSSAKAM